MLGKAGQVELQHGNVIGRAIWQCPIMDIKDSRIHFMDYYDVTGYHAAEIEVSHLATRTYGVRSKTYQLNQTRIVCLLLLYSVKI